MQFTKVITLSAAVATTAFAGTSEAEVDAYATAPVEAETVKEAYTPEPTVLSPEVIVDAYTTEAPVSHEATIETAYTPTAPVVSPEATVDDYTTEAPVSPEATVAYTPTSPVDAYAAPGYNAEVVEADVDEQTYDAEEENPEAAVVEDAYATPEDNAAEVAEYAPTEEEVAPEEDEGCQYLKDIEGDTYKYYEAREVVETEAGVECTGNHADLYNAQNEVVVAKTTYFKDSGVSVLSFSAIVLVIPAVLSLF